MPQHLETFVERFPEEARNIPALWRGLHAGTGSPDLPLLDRFLGDRLRARGLNGTRDRRRCVFASCDKIQATDYASSPEHVYRVVPHPQSLITWADGVNDMGMAFVDDFRYARADEIDVDMTPQARGVLRRFLEDCAGHAETLEIYLSLGRMHKPITLLVDLFLDSLCFHEHIFAELPKEALLKHRGEVWITGPVLLAPESNTER